MLALAEGGIAAVGVERLAKRLGVTKGSFYWHFKDHGALITELLERWEKAAVATLIDRVERAGGTARDRLWRLFELAIQEGYGAAELAIRGWAGSDEAAAGVLRRVDGRRIAYLEGLFREMALSEDDARARSRLVYCALVGEHTMRFRAPLERRLKVARTNFQMLTLAS